MFWEPGSGKTVTAMTAADRLMHEMMAVDRTIIVGPKMVAQEVWWREAARWDSLKHLRVHLLTAADFGYKRRTTWSAILHDEEREIIEPGATADDMAFLARAKVEGVAVPRHEVRPCDPKAAARAILDRQEAFTVVGRDHLYNLARLLGDAWPWRMMLGDESTSFKQYDSDRSRAVMYLRKKGLVERLVLLSGTPRPKDLEQFWAQVRLLDLGERLGESVTAFRKAYMVADKMESEWAARQAGRRPRVFSYRDAPGAVEEVMAKVGDICMSVRADIWRENEPPRVVKRMVRLPDEAMTAYETLAEDYVLQVPSGTVRAVNAGVLAGKLAQVASGFVYDGDRCVSEIHDAKMDALEELIDELGGEPLLVLYWFQPTLARLKKRFKHLMTSKTPGFIDKFGQGLGGLLALQPAGAGHGLDGLQHGGHHVAVLDLHPDWELYKQAVDRLDRSGQKHQVTVTQIVAAGTNDEIVSDVLFERGMDNGKLMDALAWRMEGSIRRHREGCFPGRGAIFAS